MLKLLAIFALSILIFSVRANAQANNAEVTAKYTEPSITASAIVAQQSTSYKIQDKEDNQVNADIRVVSTPEKDFYDKAPFWINLILAVIGTLGIGAAFKTLHKLERQTKATENQVTASHDGLRAWIAAAVEEIDYAEQPFLPITERRAFYKIENYGQTPAFIKAIYISNRAHPIASSGSWENFSKPISPNRFLGSGMCEKHLMTLSGEALSQCESGQMVWRFVVKIEYEDVFEKSHETMASFHYYVPQKSSDPLERGFYQETGRTTNYNT